jgi:hypothetical protein
MVISKTLPRVALAIESRVALAIELVPIIPSSIGVSLATISSTLLVSRRQIAAMTPIGGHSISGESPPTRFIGRFVVTQTYLLAEPIISAELIRRVLINVGLCCFQFALHLTEHVQVSWPIIRSAHMVSANRR